MITSMTTPIISTSIRIEQDVVAARQRARFIAELLKFDTVEQTRIATVVSELTRNVQMYAGEGKIEFMIQKKPQGDALLIKISDKGPGIENIKEILDGNYRSRSGMGVGINGCRRIMDEFNIDTKPGAGTTISLLKYLPENKLQANIVSKLSEELTKQKVHQPIDELQQQNRELINIIKEVEKRQSELSRINDELNDTNRGVIALYAELDEQALKLKRMDEIKSRFLSNMSHEFRTPVTSVLKLSEFLMEEINREENEEHYNQIKLINRSMRDLLDLVNDLLDLAKVEAGKFTTHITKFTVSDLFSALRGVFRPLISNPNVKLIFIENDELPEMNTDEGKVGQILRNFISNALKFTNEGIIEVNAICDNQNNIIFCVKDTGIGIAEEDQPFIFEEFAQVDNPMQKGVKGTGLGLPLSRKLAELLGGSISLISEIAVGSVFVATIPAEFNAREENKVVLQ